MLAFQCYLSESRAQAIGFLEFCKFRTPDVAPQFQPGGENGLSHSFRWRELRRWGRRCRLPARAGLGPPLEIGSSEGEHRLPHPRAHCKFHDIRSSEVSLKSVPQLGNRGFTLAWPRSTEGCTRGDLKRDLAPLPQVLISTQKLEFPEIRQLFPTQPIGFRRTSRYRSRATNIATSLLRSQHRCLAEGLVMPLE